MFSSTSKQHRHSNQKYDSAIRSLAKAGVALVLFAAIPLASPALADTWLNEVHAFEFDFANPVPGSIFEYNIDLPLFNTNGGARNFVAFRVDYNISWDYTYTVSPNPTQQWHGCDVSWRQVWSSTLDGQPWFPLDQSPDHRYLDASGGVGAICGPAFAGNGPIDVDGMGIGHNNDAHTDAALLSRLTGDGIATVECTQTLSALTFAAPDARRWPPYVPQDQRIFDPDMIDVTMDRIGMDVTVTYYWTPEPGTLALLFCGAPALRRRR
jgi:hypothetical protein